MGTVVERGRWPKRVECGKERSDRGVGGAKSERTVSEEKSADCEMRRKVRTIWNGFETSVETAKATESRNIAGAGHNNGSTQSKR